MATKKLSPEIEALNNVIFALEGLDATHQSWVLETAASRFGINMRGFLKSQPNIQFQGVVKSPDLRDSEISPKDFLKAKDPKNDIQRAACLAFYLTYYRETPHFKSRDLSLLNMEAAGPRVNMSRAVNNAMNQNRYLAVAGGGRKQITTLGEEIVNALPDPEAVGLAEQKAKSTIRVRKTRKAKSKDKEVKKM